MNKEYPKNFKDLINPIKKELIITVILAFLGTVALLIVPIAITQGVHKYFAENFDSFFIWIMVAALGLIFKQILHVLSLGYAHIVEAKFRYKLRKDFSDKLSRLPLGFFTENSSGAIRKLISEDTVKIHTVIAHAFSDITAGVTLPIACAITMLIFEWHTALIVLGFIFLVLIINMIWMSFTSKGMDEINKKYEVAQREMSHSAIEMVDGIKEIKNFGISGSLFKRFDNALQRFSTASFEWLNRSSKAFSFLMAIIQPTVMLFISFSACIFAIKKAWLFPEYTILFMLLSISLPSSLISFMQIANHIRDGKHSINTLLDLYAKADQEYKENSKSFNLGDIEFKDVNFSYDEESVILSGGEKQRLTIARAFLADTPIVLLDEATAQADAESEAEIQKALSTLSQNKTVVIIAHRLSSIVNADKILVLDKGKIIQEGRHSELLEKDGMYKNMWLVQNIDKKQNNFEGVI